MIYVMTKAGLSKDISEDAVLVGNQIFSNVTDMLEVPTEGLICIADGVGGNSAGEVASTFVLNSLLNYTWSDERSIREKLIEINRQLITTSKGDSNLSNMATTLSGVYIRNGKLKLIHVGNTRVYAMQGHYLKQLTSDHTVYNWLKSLGRIEEAEACNKNEITSCFGGGDEKLIEKVYIQSMGEVQTLLLTSDGIHDYVCVDSLEDIINSDISNEDKCSVIQETALHAGSTDDMTAVLICMREN